MTDTEVPASPELSVKLFQAAKAGDLDAVNEYIAAGANVAFQDHEGVSPLMTAAEEGHAEVVAALLQAGAPWNQQVRLQDITAFVVYWFSVPVVAFRAKLPSEHPR